MPNERKLERQQEHLEERRDRIDRKLDANERHQDNLERRHDSPERRYESLDRGGENGTSPVFHPNRRTKVLISPGPGASWITEAPHGASDAFLVWMLTYEPLIHALERRDHRERIEEILQDFHRECRVGYHFDRITTPRADDLVVRDVDEPFEVKEDHGRERIEHVNHLEMMSHRRVIRM